MTVPHEWKMAVRLFLNADVYNPKELKDAAAERTDWIEQVRRQFEEVLRTRPVDVDWYIEEANANFDDEERLYTYLQEVYDYIFLDGPWPDEER